GAPSFRSVKLFSFQRAENTTDQRICNASPERGADGAGDRLDGRLADALAVGGARRRLPLCRLCRGLLLGDFAGLPRPRPEQPTGRFIIVRLVILAAKTALPHNGAAHLGADRPEQ